MSFRFIRHAGSLALLILFVMAGVLAVPARAQDAGGQTASADNGWWKDITLNAFVSAAYSYNFNKPDEQTNQFRVFDFDDNSFKLDVFELVLQRPVANAGDAGFRVDLEAGASIPRITASAGLFRNADGTGEDFDVQQAYISYIADAGNGLRFDFGKFITHTGSEVIEGYDGYNDNYSRSILFGYAIPFTHTGLKVSYPFSGKVSGMFMLANGCDVVKDNNRGKTIGGQLGLAPNAKSNIYLNYVGGPERADSGDWRNVFDVVAIWKATGKFTITGNFDYGHETNAAGPNQDGTWVGIAGYLRTQVSPHFALILRGEHFDDQDGVRTGVVQKLNEFTVTPEFKVTDKFVVRGDLRFDHSDEQVFDDHEDYSDSQTTIALNTIYVF